MISRELQIRLTACRLLKETSSDLCCAVSTTQLLRDISKYRISCVSTYLHGLDGFTSYDSTYDKYLIVISPRNFSRRKFTIAHELGHVYLGHLKGYNNSMAINSRSLEIEANIFAEELLMPTLGIIHTGLNTAEEISDYYAVSLGSAKIKYNSLKRNALYRDYLKHIDMIGEYYENWNICKTIY